MLPLHNQRMYQRHPPVRVLLYLRLEPVRLQYDLASPRLSVLDRARLLLDRLARLRQLLNQQAVRYHVLPFRHYPLGQTDQGWGQDSRRNHSPEIKWMNIKMRTTRMRCATLIWRTRPDLESQGG